MGIRILVAVDGSEHALRAVEHAIKLCSANPQTELHLLTVQIPVDSGHARLFVSHDQLEDYYREEGLVALQSATALLTQADQAFTPHIAVGHTTETIVRYASELKFDQLIIGSHGRSGLSALILGSIAKELVKLSSIPVTVVK